jgi:hypothetical protein
LRGGRIQVSSIDPGQGSEFLVCLSRSLIIEPNAQQIEVGGKKDSDSAPKRILVADDNRDAAESLGMLLSLSGHEVHIAHTGAEALENGKTRAFRYRRVRYWHARFRRLWTCGANMRRGFG